MVLVLLLCLLLLLLLLLVLLHNFKSQNPSATCRGVSSMAWGVVGQTPSHLVHHRRYRHRRGRRYP